MYHNHLILVLDDPVNDVGHQQSIQKTNQKVDIQSGTNVKINILIAIDGFPEDVLVNVDFLTN